MIDTQNRPLFTEDSEGTTTNQAKSGNNRSTTGLKALQQQFMQTFQGADASAFKQLVLEQGKVDVEQRIDIYSHAYVARLKECIETDHELLAIYLGDELFEQMVQGYVAQHPSTLTSLRHFCDALPDYLLAQTPFKSYPIVSEIARFERRLLDAFDARDEMTAKLEDLQRINAEHWPAMQFTLHPSVVLFSSDWNCVAVWQSLKQQQTPPEAQTDPQSWVIWRNKQRLTEFNSLDSTAYVMLDGMLQGQSFSVLCENLSEFVAYDLVGEKALACLLDWIEAGIISACYID